MMTGYVTCESDTYDALDDCFDPKEKNFEEYLEVYKARYLGE